jgi:hypothetical protein
MHGSFIISAIGKDGITIASDSRGAFSIKKQNVKVTLAYFDGAQKIFIFKHCALALTGAFQFGNLFMSTIISDFKKNINDDTINVNNLLTAFFNHCQKKYSRLFSDKIFKDPFISAGYENHHPKIIMYDPLDKKTKVVPVGGFCESYKSSFNYDPMDSCSTISKKAEAAILDFAQMREMTETIGGPISILKISEKKISFTQNPPIPFKWVYYRDFIEDYLHKKINLTFTSPENKVVFDKQCIAIENEFLKAEATRNN